ncbi:MAG TPA: delta-60 repeat domain-containing protein, partial [Flavobacteriales bacterium]|nr:delta-60 repeat domain-containing protein [Flavobacteriales bacterium]
MTRSLLLLLLACPLFAAAQPGSLDPTFGTAGLVQTTINANSSATSVAMQADGKIVCAGTTEIYAMVARYLSEGSLDPAFGTDGIAQLDLQYGQMRKVLVQPDGKILTTGSSDVGTFLARFLPDGTLDGSFGVDGLVQADNEGGTDFPWDMVLRPDGRIVLLQSHSVGGVASIQVAAYSAGGVLDASFGDQGLYRLVSPASTTYFPWAIALQADGKALIGGVQTTPLQYRFVLRLNTDGTADQSFGNGGYLNLTDIATAGVEDVDDLLVDD